MKGLIPYDAFDTKREAEALANTMRRSDMRPQFVRVKKQYSYAGKGKDRWFVFIGGKNSRKW